MMIKIVKMYKYNIITTNNYLNCYNDSSSFLSILNFLYNTGKHRHIIFNYMSMFVRV